MHSKTLFSIFLGLVFFAFLPSCDILDDDLFPNDPSNPNSPTTGPSGQWSVTWFWDKDKDETHKFNGYTFLFQTNGTLEALQNGNVVQTGSWTITNSNRMVISMGSAEPLEELNDDWIILLQTDDQIKLKDDNEEHLEELHFSKN